MFVFIQDREVPVSLFRHDILDGVCIITQTKSNKITGFHKEFYRHTLVDETCHRIRIMRGTDNSADPLGRQTLDRLGDRSPLADDDAARFHLMIAHSCDS